MPEVSSGWRVIQQRASRGWKPRRIWCCEGDLAPAIRPADAAAHFLLADDYGIDGVSLGLHQGAQVETLSSFSVFRPSGKG